MSDIVERLRARLKHLQLGQAPAENLMDEAADEIERLREQYAPAIERLSAARRSDEAEIERLRAALREIVDYDTRHYAHDGNAHIVNTARAALVETKDE